VPEFIHGAAAIALIIPSDLSIFGNPYSISILLLALEIGGLLTAAKNVFATQTPLGRSPPHL
jgi:hypothetical protein